MMSDFVEELWKDCAESGERWKVGELGGPSVVVEVRKQAGLT